MSLPDLKSSLRRKAEIQVRTDLLPHLKDIAYEVTAELHGFSTLQLTWGDHARVLTRLAEIPASTPRPRQRRTRQEADQKSS